MKCHWSCVFSYTCVCHWGNASSFISMRGLSWLSRRRLGPIMSVSGQQQKKRQQVNRKWLRFPSVLSCFILMRVMKLRRTWKTDIPGKGTNEETLQTICLIFESCARGFAFTSLSTFQYLSVSLPVATILGCWINLSWMFNVCVCVCIKDHAHVCPCAWCGSLQ